MSASFVIPGASAAPGLVLAPAVGVRSFEFPDGPMGEVSLATARRIIESALDDESLAIAPRAGRLRVMWAIRQPDALLVFVAESAIVAK